MSDENTAQAPFAVAAVEVKVYWIPLSEAEGELSTLSPDSGGPPSGDPIKPGLGPDSPDAGDPHIKVSSLGLGPEEET